MALMVGNTVDVFDLSNHSLMSMSFPIVEPTAGLSVVGDIPTFYESHFLRLVI
jgi:hypothetical protein